MRWSAPAAPDLSERWNTLPSVEYDQAKHGPYMARMEKWDDDQVFLAATRVQSLLDQPGWEVIQGLQEEVHQRTMMRLLTGPIQEQAEYARDLATARSAKEAEAAAEAVLLKAERVREGNERGQVPQEV